MFAMNLSPVIRESLVFVIVDYACDHRFKGFQASAPSGVALSINTDPGKASFQLRHYKHSLLYFTSPSLRNTEVFYLHFPL
jgi:hypothetical protein